MTEQYQYKTGKDRNLWKKETCIKRHQMRLMDWISCGGSMPFDGRGRWVVKMEECNLLAKPGPPGGWNLYFIQHCQLMPAASAQHHSSSPALYSTHLFRWFTQKWIRLQLSIGQNTEVSAIMKKWFIQFCILERWTATQFPLWDFKIFYNCVDTD